MATELFAEMGGKVYGPLTADQVRKLASSGRLKPEDRIRKGVDGPWARAGKVPGLFDAEPASAGTSLVPTGAESRPQSVAVRPTPAQVVAAVYGNHAAEPKPANPPPLPERRLAPTVPEFAAPGAYPAAPQAPTPFAQAPAHYPPQPMPQAQPYAPYGYPPQQPPAVIVHNTIVNAAAPAYVIRPQKSAALAALLAFLFGPLGMLYSTVTGALVLFGINLILVLPTFGLIVLVTWPAGIVCAAIAANNNSG